MLKYQYHKAFLVCIFLVTSIIISHGQIKGSIKDKAGNILPYASVYIEGTSTGTVSNAAGDYELEIKEVGNITITCQYVGYKKETLTIRYDGCLVLK